MADPRRASNPSSPLRAVDGRVAGRRGQETRQRLLDATRAVISEQSYLDLTVAAVARRAETSPATFYQYFPDAKTALLSLLSELADTGGPELRRMVTEFGDSDGLPARRIAQGFLGFFRDHGDLLRVADLVALEGDERFRQLRTSLFNGVFLALQDLAHEAWSTGRLPAGASPAGVASVLTTMLTQVSSHQDGYVPWGVSGEDLERSMAAVISRLLGDEV